MLQVPDLLRQVTHGNLPVQIQIRIFESEIPVGQIRINPRVNLWDALVSRLSLVVLLLILLSLSHCLCMRAVSKLTRLLIPSSLWQNVTHKMPPSAMSQYHVKLFSFIPFLSLLHKLLVAVFSHCFFVLGCSRPPFAFVLFVWLASSDWSAHQCKTQASA